MTYTAEFGVLATVASALFAAVVTLMGLIPVLTSMYEQRFGERMSGLVARQDLQGILRALFVSSVLFGGGIVVPLVAAFGHEDSRCLLFSGTLCVLLGLVVVLFLAFRLVLAAVRVT